LTELFEKIKSGRFLGHSVHASMVAPVNAKEEIRPLTILKTREPIVTKIGLVDDVGDPYL